MRVISGKYKGRRLVAPHSESKIRPTADRVKESMFNLLQKYDFVDREVADIFCGSGALGIEALSRGASMAYFVDSDKNSLSLTKKNLDLLKENSFKLLHTSYENAFSLLKGKKLAIIFADPPYDLDCAHSLIANAFLDDVLSEDGVLILEMNGKKSKALDGAQNLLQNNHKGIIIEVRKYGNSAIAVVGKQACDLVL